MTTPSKREPDLLQENAELRARLEEAEETLRAIRAGEVDALVMGEQVYSLQSAETPYRILIEAMNEGAATLGQDGTVLYGNRRLAELLRAPLLDVIGASLRRFVAPADLPVFNAMVAQSGQQAGIAEVTFLGPNGSRVPVQLSFSSLDVQGSRGLCVVATDLTERKRAEQALWEAHHALEERVVERTAELDRQREWLSVTLGSIGDAVIATDREGRIMFLNAVAEALTGWPRQEAVGQPILTVFRIIDAATRAPGEDIVGRVLREGAVVRLANHSALFTRDGGEVSVEDSAAPIRDGTGQVIGVVLVFHDVTEKRRAVEALREANEELTRFNRAMVGRELRMIELKKEINELCRQASQPPRYAPAEAGA